MLKTITAIEDDMEIYQWRDDKREPNLAEDTLRILEQKDVRQLYRNIRAYIDYLIQYKDVYVDYERDAVQFLIDTNGDYKNITVETVKYYRGDIFSLDEINEEGLFSIEALSSYILDNGSDSEVRLLCIRYLCHILEHNKNGYTGIKNDVEIPKNIEAEFNNIVANLLPTAFCTIGM